MDKSWISFMLILSSIIYLVKNYDLYFVYSASSLSLDILFNR